MKASLAAYLDHLDPWVSPELVSPAYLDYIKKLSSELPILSFGCFECWLGPDIPRVDFNISIEGSLNEHKTLGQWIPDHTAGGHLRGKSGTRVSSMLDSWINSDSYFHSIIKLMWLVYDIPNTQHPIPTPWVYVHFRKGRLDFDSGMRTELVLRSLTLWKEESYLVPPSQLRPFLDAIPPSVGIGAVGRTTRRGDGYFRLYLISESWEELETLLQKNQWQGNSHELREKISDLNMKTRVFGLLIDLSSSLVIQPKIGIEAWFDKDEAQHQLQMCTQRLIRLGLCTAEKQNALLEWNGRMVIDAQPHDWSWPDAWPEIKNRSSVKIEIHRKVHYIKLVYEPDVPLSAKVYLYFDRCMKPTP